MTLVKLTFSLSAGQRDDAREQRDPGGPRQVDRGGDAEHRAERVGARVAEHGALAQVLGKQRERRAERGGNGARRAAARAPAAPR